MTFIPKQGRLIPVILLPKEFAGTVIKITRPGIVKEVIPTFSRSSKEGVVV